MKLPMKRPKAQVTAKRIDAVKIELSTEQLEQALTEWARTAYPEYTDFAIDIHIDCGYDQPETTIKFERTTET